MLPSRKIATSSWKIPDHIKLADPTFNEPNKIDILLGQELFFDILKDGKIKHDSMPFLQNTSLGWIIGGSTGDSESNYSTKCHLSISERLDQQLQRFWKIEEPTNKVVMTSDDELCERLYQDTVKRTEEGRYVVTMPFKQGLESLGPSKVIATRRLIQVERRLKRQPDLHGQYSQFLNEYKDLGHMSPIHPTSNLCSTEYYMPHHPVLKESSTTKLRVVFDASCKTTNDISLNDLLLVGPTIQDDLFSIVTRFRMHNIVMTADIEKMYRQILIDQNQRSLQKILWRESPTDALTTFKLNTVTYGTACAPFLAVRTLHQLASDEGHHFPEAAKVLRKDFYMDDCLCGANTIEEALQLQQQLIGILKAGGFNLRKWKANNNKLLESLPADMREQHPKEITTSSASKTLGLLWDAAEEKLLFSYKEGDDKSKIKLTKRTILSTVAKLFDPLGLVSPIIIRAKILLQGLWQEKFNWDEELPSSFKYHWSEIQQSLCDLNKVKITRCVTTQQLGDTLELHGFCDASERAYGAAVYIASSNDYNRNASLLCAKSRVAPIKTVSIPRLELCGALLLAELVEHVVQALDKKINQIYFWTDSTIVLCWLASEAATWKTFVATRVAKIHDLSRSGQWGHVNSEENPADLVSRGVNTNDLASSDLWWSGPKWLNESQNKWPDSKFNTYQYNDKIPERKKESVTATSVTTDQELSELINRFSDFPKLQRTTAYVLRFIHNCRFPNAKQVGVSLPDELTSSLQVLIKHEQNKSFSKDVTQLKQGGQVSKSSKIRFLKSFIDENGIVRVGGRLHFAQLHNNQKHPILLPDKSHLTELIVLQEHKRSLHSGPQLLLSLVRHQFWPLNGRNITRKVVHKCVTCFKAKPRWNQPEMGNLPSTRVTPSHTFINVGLDYCGPIYLRSGRNRKSNLYKGYIAVFVCFATKAIHLELVPDLTTEAFLASFKRFISRRGLCQNVYCDNGTTFVGAQNELKELYKLIQDEEHQDTVRNRTAAQNITWHFIPAKSPHFGGLWEAGVKSVKHHLKRVTGNTNMTFEELYTTLTLIEACLNSRPLTVLSSDPNDPSPLTPGHFLIGRPLISLPEPNYMATPVNRLSHWQRAQQLMQHFWQRWSTEYLSNQQQRQKWTSKSPDIHPGQVVLIRDANLPPLKWVTGIVHEVHPGADGCVRVATVKTSTGLFKRPSNRLCVLPIESV